MARGYKPGHAYIAVAKWIDHSGGYWDDDFVFGLYPKEKISNIDIALTFLSSTKKVDAGDFKSHKRLVLDSKPEIAYIVWVDNSQYQKLISVYDQYRTMGVYGGYDSDCVSFVRDAAKAVGLSIPERRWRNRPKKALKRIITLNTKNRKTLLLPIYNRHYTKFPKNAARRIRVTKVGLNSASKNLTLDCSKECQADHSSPLCLKLALPPLIWSQITVLRSEVLGLKKGKLKRKKLGSIFGMRDDPCSRSDTFFDQGYMLNFGKRCNISANFKNFDLVLSLKVPRLLEAKWIADGANFEAIFENSSWAPDVIFKYDPLNSEFGGRVKKVSGSKSTALFTMPNGCISLEPKG